MTRRRPDRPGRRPHSRIVTGTGRETDLGRHVDRYEQLPTVLIATNGKSTEPAYLRELKREPWVRVGRVAVKFLGGSPVDLVKAAAGLRDREDYDEVWAVCDVDDYDTAAAVDDATARDVRLIWSNPCFEVWLTLHRADCATYFENAAKAEAKLRSILGNWDKTKLDFAAFRSDVDDAVRRAKALAQPPKANPSTAVWQLVEMLRQDQASEN